ncbi:MAG: peptidyl-prolyl cis-trans isomerase [Wenzhouxiangellaceae bacterium]
MIITLAISGCDRSDDRYALVSGEDVVLVEVDGHPVTLPMLEFMMSTRAADPEDTEAMRRQFDELLRLRAIANRAEREGIADQVEVRAQRAVRDMEIKYMSFIEDWQRRNPVTDEQIEAAYQAQLERSGDHRFIIETIEFDDQPAALEQLDLLASGQEDFSAAIDRATEQGRIARRTDWVDLSQVPPDFGEILKETAVGEIVDSILPYQGKWIVVQVSDRDELVPPSLGDVREGIRRTLARERVRAMIEETFGQAQVTPILPLEQADQTD